MNAMATKNKQSNIVEDVAAIAGAILFSGYVLFNGFFMLDSWTGTKTPATVVEISLITSQQTELKGYKEVGGITGTERFYADSKWYKENVKQ